MHASKQSHLDSAVKVRRCIRDTPGLGLLMAADSKKEITAFFDSDWASSPITRKSLTGIASKLGTHWYLGRLRTSQPFPDLQQRFEYRAIALQLVRSYGTRNFTEFETEESKAGALCDKNQLNIQQPIQLSWKDNAYRNWLSSN